MIKRTSIKAFLFSSLMLFVYLVAGWTAIAERESSPFRLSHPSVTPQNLWDYVALAAIVFCAASAAVGFMFLNKDD